MTGINKSNVWRNLLKSITNYIIHIKDYKKLNYSPQNYIPDVQVTDTSK